MSDKKEIVAKATLRRVRISPRKARLVLDVVKGKPAQQALQDLAFSPTKGAEIIEKLLRSAVANAKEQSGSDVDELVVAGGWVDMAKTMKRFRPRAQGRATPIRKKSSHITLQLAEL